MKRYVLRRDNVETGPYSLTEILDKGLLPFDLIGMQDSNDSWQYPGQIQELKDHVRVLDTIEETYLSLYDVSRQELGSLESNQNTIPGTNHSIAKRDTRVPNKRISRLTFAGFIAVGVCSFLAVLLIKNMFDALGSSSRFTAKTIQVSKAASEPTTNQLIQNALAVEVINSKNKEKAHYPVVMKLREIRKLVTVKTAETNISVAGLTSTQLFISNESPKLVDRTTIQLTYEKPGGEVLKQETFAVPMLRPFSTRVMEVPVDEKDVKVKARVLNIYSLHNGPELRRI